MRVNSEFNVSVLKPYEVPVDEPDDELSEEPAVMEDLPPHHQECPIRLGNFHACAITCTRFQKPQQLSWSGCG